MKRNNDDLLPWIAVVAALIAIILGCIRLDERIIAIEDKLGITKEQQR